MFLDIPMLISGSNADTKSEVPRGDDTLDDLEVFFILKRLETSSLQKVEQKIMPPYLSRYQLAEPENQPLQKEKLLLQITNFLWFHVSERELSKRSMKHFFGVFSLFGYVLVCQF